MADSGTSGLSSRLAKLNPFSSSRRGDDDEEFVGFDGDLDEFDVEGAEDEYVHSVFIHSRTSGTQCVRQR